MFTRINKVYHEFPAKFWVVVAASFIDGIGGTLLWPFFALYITQKFNVGMTVAGLMLALNSAAAMVGSTFGGALTDKFGRRSIILFGLVFSSISALALGLVTDIGLFWFTIIVVGLLAHVAGPAHNAMIADLLPEEQRAEGFGILRVVGNLAWIIGPSIGGIMAKRSFLSLFILDAVISLITAVIFFRLIPETKPQPRADSKHETLLQTFSGYRHVFADRAFLAFIFASILMLLVYQQMYGTLSVYLRDVHSIDPQRYGYLMSSSAILVVFTQFSVSRYIKRFPPLLMMAVATGFYMVGFTMFGVVTAYALFILAVLIITIGEMIGVPTNQSLMAAFAPEEMRGRYMAIGGLSWALPSMIGPWAAGLILDNYDPNWVWYAGGILCALACMSFYALHLKLGERKEFQPAPEAEAA